MNTFTPIPAQFAADMAAAARRDTLAQREQRKAMIAFAITAAVLVYLIYLAW
jgi:hypothetical protein